MTESTWPCVMPTLTLLTSPRALSLLSLAQPASVARAIQSATARQLGMAPPNASPYLPWRLPWPQPIPCHTGHLLSVHACTCRQPNGVTAVRGRCELRSSAYSASAALCEHLPNPSSNPLAVRKDMILKYGAVRDGNVQRTHALHRRLQFGKRRGVLGRDRRHLRRKAGCGP